MEIIAKLGAIHQETVDAIVVSTLEDAKPEGAIAQLDSALDGAINALIEGGDFAGKAGQIAVLYPHGSIPSRRVLLVGLGKQEDIDLNSVRKAAGAAAAKARDLGAKQVTTAVHGAPEIELAKRVQAVVEGALLGLYQYPAERQKAPEKEKELESLTVLVNPAESLATVETAIELAEKIAAGVNLTRTLVNHPSNIGTPTLLGETALAFAEQHGLKCTVYERDWIREQNMGSFLAVTQGAGQPPKFIVLEHDPGIEGADTIVLVGKGLTFDSGGISLKPGERMHMMKGDMAGGGAVLGAMKAIGAIQPPVRVIGLVPATDNMPDAHAYKPGDVVRAMNGKTIEVINTDAEGRMLLADALCYASQYQPAAVIDLATLTGSCVTALGRGMAAGCFANDDDLCEKLMAAGKTTAERLWRLPLFKEYREMLKSDVADMQHTGGRFSGVGSSATFLQEFTDYPWVHLDIAPMTYSDAKAPNPYTPKGATGFGVRLLVNLVLNW